MNRPQFYYDNIHGFPSRQQSEVNFPLGGSQYMSQIQPRDSFMRIYVRTSDDKSLMMTVSSKISISKRIIYNIFIGRLQVIIAANYYENFMVHSQDQKSFSDENLERDETELREIPISVKAIQQKNFLIGVKEIVGQILRDQDEIYCQIQKQNIQEIMKQNSDLAQEIKKMVKIEEQYEDEDRNQGQKSTVPHISIESTPQKKVNSEETKDQELEKRKSNEITTNLIKDEAQPQQIFKLENSEIQVQQHEPIPENLKKIAQDEFQLIQPPLNISEAQKQKNQQQKDQPKPSSQNENIQQTQKTQPESLKNTSESAQREEIQAKQQIQKQITSTNTKVIESSNEQNKIKKEESQQNQVSDQPDELNKEQIQMIKHLIEDYDQQKIQQSTLQQPKQKQTNEHLLKQDQDQKQNDNNLVEQKVDVLNPVQQEIEISSIKTTISESNTDVIVKQKQKKEKETNQIDLSSVKEPIVNLNKKSSSVLPISNSNNKIIEEQLIIDSKSANGEPKSNQIQKQQNTNAAEKEKRKQSKTITLTQDKETQIVEEKEQKKEKNFLKVNEPKIAKESKDNQIEDQIQIEKQAVGVNQKAVKEHTDKIEIEKDQTTKISNETTSNVKKEKSVENKVQKQPSQEFETELKYESDYGEDDSGAIAEETEKAQNQQNDNQMKTEIQPVKDLDVQKDQQPSMHEKKLSNDVPLSQTQVQNTETQVKQSEQTKTKQNQKTVLQVDSQQDDGNSAENEPNLKPFANKKIQTAPNSNSIEIQQEKEQEQEEKSSSSGNKNQNDKPQEDSILTQLNNQIQKRDTNAFSSEEQNQNATKVTEAIKKQPQELNLSQGTNEIQTVVDSEDQTKKGSLQSQNQQKNQENDDDDDDDDLNLKQFEKFSQVHKDHVMKRRISFEMKPSFTDTDSSSEDIKINDKGRLQKKNLFA